ncbi:MAG TPA: tRNA (adenosine(37)-N6)-threonylcarbamoyltransferase complex ATPase subunit type 1 TsaE [Thermoanaerobaculia bacterium]|nr:tRNA (adenosine(37)-N6)-threonylcarbamoyltransferase complex ATPase subunit type 1 TsaE [Thermoanaerobaculia bacterium]
MSVRSWTSRSEQDTAAAGREIAHELGQDEVVFLTGDLGAGKTTLVRAIAAELGADGAEVTSPTFAIVHEYPRADGSSIVHVDGYRLTDQPDEWQRIGMRELLRSEGVKMIEWPKDGFTSFAPASAEIGIELVDGESRTITFTRKL